MNEVTDDVGARHFHKLYGARQPRMSYKKEDCIDYTLMTIISAVVIGLAYGPDHWLSLLGVALCVFMILVFPMRHGFGWRMPVILQRPQDILNLFVHKAQNVKPSFWLAIAVLLLENYFIYLTPDLPHHSEQLRTIAIWLFFGHLIGLSLYRTLILIEHLRKREFVRQVLLETTWKRFLVKQPNITLHIVHAYVTGLLTHIVLVAPWYLVITHARFSVIALPATLLLNGLTQYHYMRTLNDWFYRDHWLGHNSELEFVYLHGTHHDAIPSGLIGVAGNGHLEGFLRYVTSAPFVFYNPLLAAVFFTGSVKQDIDSHQYIPGVFPRQRRQFLETSQHSVHHYGRLEPYGLALKFDQPHVSDAYKKSMRLPDEIANSIRLDERLTGFKWNNSSFRRFMELFDKYQS
jgi:hypothetical protein